MKLTDVERGTLLMLHQILAKLEPQQSEYHERAVKILLDGYYEMWDSEVIGHLSEPVSKEQMSYVHDILDMYRWLQDSYISFSKEEKSKVEESDVLFMGFDGNNETELLGYARFLMEDMDKWSDLKHNGSLNTHYPTENQYRAMLRALPKREGRSLSAEEISTVVSAHISPNS